LSERPLPGTEAGARPAADAPLAGPGAAGGPAMAMPAWLDLLGGLVGRTRAFWRKVGDLETEQHAEALAAIAIDRPVYIAGLARSGSTILLESLARLPGVASHQYRDFPLLFAPLHWDRMFGRRQGALAEPAERAHQDRIRVTPSSPEAMEEVLWMAFFDHLHDASRDQVLDARASAPAFEAFYRDHLKKILLLRQGRRYLAKGNYNVTRLAYLLKLFPDARFLVPVREPGWHVASLIKQHRLFAAAERNDPRILRHMRRVGHFEFGLDRRAINSGDAAIAQAIERDWAEGRDALGYARLWAAVYGFVLDQLAAEPALARATRIVRYEDLCADPAAELAAIADHTALPLDDERRLALAATISSPDYYRPAFSAAETALLEAATDGTARRLGYRR